MTTWAIVAILLLLLVALSAALYTVNLRLQLAQARAGRRALSELPPAWYWRDRRAHDQTLELVREYVAAKSWRLHASASTADGQGAVRLEHYRAEQRAYAAVVARLAEYPVERQRQETRR